MEELAAFYMMYYFLETPATFISAWTTKKKHFLFKYTPSSEGFDTFVHKVYWGQTDPNLRNGISSADISTNISFDFLKEILQSSQGRFDRGLNQRS